MNCKIGQIPFIYFCLPIRGEPHCLSLWSLFIEKICKKLSDWNSIKQSMDDRFALLKFVLSSFQFIFFHSFRLPQILLFLYIISVLILSLGMLVWSLVGGCLRTRFKYLFDLYVDKNVIVDNMMRYEWG